MKILITIPHYYKHDQTSKYASSYMNNEARAKVLEHTITSIFDVFNPTDKYIDNSVVDNKLVYYLEAANTRLKDEIDICICTYKNFHLLDIISTPKHKYHQIDVEVPEPIYLEFGCLKVLQNNLNHYDYYCMMEDDLVIHDPYFFQKLAWFESMFGTDCLLQPHRYITNQYPKYTKIYCDQEFHKSFIAKWVDFSVKPNLEALYLSKTLRFVKTANPHSGAFFLSSRQFARMVNEKSYGIPTAEFISPLESAATLGIMRSFNIYKASHEDNNFLEIEHNYSIDDTANAETNHQDAQQENSKPV